MWKQIAFTPYDEKVTGSGIFKLPSTLKNIPEFKDIETLFNVAKSYRYQADIRRDNWQPAELTEKIKSGDCEDKAIWLVTNLYKHNIPSLLVIGRYNRRMHVWVQCVWKDVDYMLDSSALKKIWRVEECKYHLPLYAHDIVNKTKFKWYK